MVPLCLIPAILCGRWECSTPLRRSTLQVKSQQPRQEFFVAEVMRPAVSIEH